VRPIVIIGAGPAGLIAGRILTRRGLPVVLLERNAQAGGLARSFSWHDVDCDIGAHRYLGDGAWSEELLGRRLDIRRVSLRGALHWSGRRFPYPITPLRLVAGLPLRHTLAYGLSYIRRRRQHADNLQSLCAARYGPLFAERFIGGYTSRLLGLPFESIAAEYGRRKVGLGNDRDAAGSSHGHRRIGYPARGGFGGDLVAALLGSAQGTLHLNSQVTGIEHSGNRVTAVEFEVGAVRQKMAVDGIVSTLPLPVLLRMLGGSSRLRMQPLTILYGLLDRERATSFHMQYVFEADLPCTRITEFRQFGGGALRHSVVAVEVPGTLGTDPADLFEQLRQRRIVSGQLKDLQVVHEPEAYPVWAVGFEDESAEAMRFVGRFENLRTVGRGGSFEHWDVDRVLEESASSVRNFGRK
jgi:glycine/D-amino acid oxidase-like deaminating enzyme